ncbi:MAG: hypothetical protein ACYTFQ_21930, partial [Planctomycetota bacterium]
ASGGTTNNSTRLYFPSTVNADDILYACISQVGGTTVGTPSGFTAVGSQQQIGSTRFKWFWKRASGSESGYLTVTLDNGTNNKWTKMVSYSGCVTTGTPYDAVAGADSTGTATMSIASVSSSGADRLAVAFCSSQDSETDQAANDDATDYSETTDEKFSGYPGYFAAYDQQVGSGTVSADSFTLVNNGYAHTQVITLIGIVAAGYGNEVNTVASANIGKVNGVATANIGKVVTS